MTLTNYHNAGHSSSTHQREDTEKRDIHTTKEVTGVTESKPLMSSSAE